MEITFNDKTVSVEPNEDGMYDLNDIWCGFALPHSKRPLSWRGEVRDALSASTNLYSVKGRVPKTLATLEALYAYSMWVSIAFNMAVVRGIVAYHQRQDLAEGNETMDKFITRDPLVQELRDSFNPNRPNRHWKKRVKRRLLAAPPNCVTDKYDTEKTKKELYEYFLPNYDFVAHNS